MTSYLDTDRVIRQYGFDVYRALDVLKERSERLKKMPKEESQKEIQDYMRKAGIIDDDGNLTENYKHDR